MFPRPPASSSSESKARDEDSTNMAMAGSVTLPSVTKPRTQQRHERVSPRKATTRPLDQLPALSQQDKKALLAAFPVLEQLQDVLPESDSLRDQAIAIIQHWLQQK